MSDHIIEDSSFINSIVGENTRFKGELDLNGVLRIDGDYSGIIRTPDKVLVGRNGRAECTIYAGTIVIGGVVKGDIYSSEKIIILSTGMVIGNLTTPRLIVEEGVILDGSCKIAKDVDIDALLNLDEQEENTLESEDLEPADTGPLYETPVETITPVPNQEEKDEKPVSRDESKISLWNG